MRIWLFAALICLAFLPVFPGGAFALNPTDCRIDPPPLLERRDSRIPEALAAVGKIVRAHEAGSTLVEVEVAREVAATIAKFDPHESAGLLYVIEDMRGIGAISHEASLRFARTLVNGIDPVARQKSEFDIHPLRTYLKALEWIIDDNSENWIGKFDALEKQISSQSLCNERVFFLFLEIAEHLGAEYSPKTARPRLEILIARANDLAGVSVDELPMKWYGYQRLTAATVELCLFDLALPMLEKAKAEAKRVLNANTATAESKEWVTAAMENFAEYVADRHRNAPACRLLDNEFEGCSAVPVCRDR